ncbi:hypothetical protein ACIRPQ_19865 [Streptomyces sp. NPDC101213]|uniref:hypothetical protein n=1 Tax=Streptomyces sp. NPDC101213 TaxID=3366130 RepID=UPI0037F1F8C1
MTTSLRPAPHAAHLESLRRDDMLEITATAVGCGRTVQVAPYVLAHSSAEQREDLELITAYAAEVGWQVTRSTFADVGEPPPLAARSGFGAACRYATQGYAHGILAVARPTLTTDDDAYAQVIEHFYVRGVFLAYLPAAGDATA